MSCQFHWASDFVWHWRLYFELQVTCTGDPRAVPPAPRLTGQVDSHCASGTDCDSPSNFEPESQTRPTFTAYRRPGCRGQSAGPGLL